MYNQKFIKKEKKKGIESFLPKLLDKEIEITLNNGASFKAKLLGFSKYEIKIELLNTKKEMILFKHAILSINEVKWKIFGVFHSLFI